MPMRVGQMRWMEADNIGKRTGKYRIRTYVLVLTTPMQRQCARRPDVSGGSTSVSV